MSVELLREEIIAILRYWYIIITSKFMLANVQGELSLMYVVPVYCHSHIFVYVCICMFA